MGNFLTALFRWYPAVTGGLMLWSVRGFFQQQKIQAVVSAAPTTLPLSCSTRFPSFTFTQCITDNVSRYIIKCSIAILFEQDQ
ncbi:hypothetical protein RB195_009627 [Necator americanus]|uniref:Secreted protein n=1 Tax=Necator americanus TaxID=51031 RepID=A0ABR1CUQ7_NECAM